MMPAAPYGACGTKASKVICRTENALVLRVVEACNYIVAGSACHHQPMSPYRLQNLFRRKQKARLPADAYDLWTHNYDHEPGNLMIALDERTFAKLMQRISPAGESICGRWMRHWPGLAGAAGRPIIYGIHFHKSP